MVLTVVLIVLLVLLLGGFGYGVSPGYRGGHGPALGGVTGLLLLVVIVVLILSLFGYVGS